MNSLTSSLPFLRWLCVGTLLNVMLLAPVWLRFDALSLRDLALEAWLIVAALALLPRGKWYRILCTSVVVVVTFASLIGLGDALVHEAFGRSLNLYLDLPLLESIFDLLVGNLGPVWAWLVSLAALLLLTGLGVGIYLALLSLPRYSPGSVPGGITIGLLGAACLYLLAGATAGQRLLAHVRTPAWDTLIFQGEQVIDTHRTKRDFALSLQEIPGTLQAMPGLEGNDVFIIFIESYGMTALQDKHYAEVLVPRLRGREASLAEAGVSMISGSLEAPVRGGQSWLAHATALSGRWIDNQLLYRLLLDSDSPTLVDDFGATRHTTLAVVPAITRAWPEGEAYGFDHIHDATNLNYAGPTLNWVTMPDQYTLDHFQRTLRPRHEGPIFAQIALISSHAPWTPILPMLDDWGRIGDGRIFERWATAGEAPETLWQDPERVREHYALSVDYAVNVALRWAEDAVDDNTLLVVLGDHPPAPLITGDGAGGAVPVHILSTDPARLEPFMAHGFRQGAIPDSLEDPPGMDRLRHWFHDAFGPSAER